MLFHIILCIARINESVMEECREGFWESPKIGLDLVQLSIPAMPSFLVDPGSFWAWMSDCFPKTPLLEVRPIASHAVYYGSVNILFLCVVAFVSEDKSVGKTWILQWSLSQIPEKRITADLIHCCFVLFGERAHCYALRNSLPTHMYIPLPQSGLMEDILCCSLGTEEW